MSNQFDTFDNVADRRELVILFQRLGEKAPNPDVARATWLQKLVMESTAWKPVIDPVSCHPVGAYNLFVQIVGVLGVPIRDAAIKLERAVRDS